MRRVRLLLLAATLSIATLGASTGSALAYGRADAPLAQIELSANCDNPGFPLCSSSGVGLGGIWLWMEIDQGGMMDVAGAGCDHLPGVTAGAGSIRGTAPWWPFHGSVAQLQAAFGPDTFVVGSDPNNNYYVVPFGFAFPMTTGHYSVTLAPRVFIQSQVAP